MARQTSAVNILLNTYAATSALTSDSFAPRNPQFTIMVYATTDGTLQLRRYDLAGTARNLGSSYAVSSATPLDINIQMTLSEIDCVFTPSSQPGTVRIDAVTVTLPTR